MLYALGVQVNCAILLAQHINYKLYHTTIIGEKIVAIYVCIILYHSVYSASAKCCNIITYSIICTLQ